MELEIHPIQTDILLVLLFKPKAKFGQLNSTKMSTDHFNFHVKRLLEVRLIKKDKGFYTLTKKGKEFANRFDTEVAVLERQAKVGVLVCCVRKNISESQYLIQQRLKQPYYGFHGFISGKIGWGEELELAAKRELKEESGLSGKFKLAGIEHKMDYSQNNKLLEDKFFYIFRVDETKGKLKTVFHGGENMWLSEEKIKALPDLFDDMLEIISIVKRKKFLFFEKKYKVKKY